MSPKKGAYRLTEEAAPTSVALQLPLPLGDDAQEAPVPTPRISSAQLESLHRQLAKLLGEPLDLVGTENRRSLLSWKRGLDGLLRLRIHKRFAEAAPDTLATVAHFIRSGDKNAATEIQAFAREQGMVQQRPGRARFSSPLGRAHDLRHYLDEQNQQHFNGKFRGRIGWSRRNRRSRRKSIRLGSWSPRNRLIRIHPALDDKQVPTYVLNFIVFHEMLHAIQGAQKQGRRSIYHTRDFRRREQEHPDYERAELWIQSHLEELLSW